MFYNPEIFKDIDSILLSQPNLVDFPIVYTGPLHEFVDAGDELYPGELGQKNAVAVLRQSRDEVAIVIGGFMLNTPSVTLGGELPGIRPNLAVARRLVDGGARRRLSAHFAADQPVALKNASGNLSGVILAERGNTLRCPVQPKSPAR
jgi:hypothetical protein